MPRYGGVLLKTKHLAITFYTAPRVAIISHKQKLHLECSDKLFNYALPACYYFTVTLYFFLRNPPVSTDSFTTDHARAHNTGSSIPTRAHNTRSLVSTRAHNTIPSVPTRAHNTILSEYAWTTQHSNPRNKVMLFNFKLMLIPKLKWNAEPIASFYFLRVIWLFEALCFILASKT